MMKKYEVETSSLDDTLEVISLFEGLGYHRPDWASETPNQYGWVYAGYKDNDVILSTGVVDTTDSVGRIKITIEELRGLVGMKEYLIKKSDGSYFNQMACDRESREPHAKDWIEIPEGADFATGVWPDILFRKDGFYFECGRWVDTGVKLDHFPIGGVNLLWQRHPAIVADNVNQQPTIQDTLKQRASTYGSFEDVARTTEVIMEELGRVRVNGLSELPYPHRMALYMIASKMSRIVNGDFNFIENWHDISGYAKLIENELMQTDGATNSRVVYQVVKDGVLEDKNES